MTKILTIAPTIFFSSRGASVRILEEIKQLSKYDNEFTITTYNKGENIPSLNIERIFYTPKNLPYGPTYHRLYLNFLLFLKSYNKIRSNNYDIIHAHLTEGGFIGNYSRSGKKIPLILDAQGSIVQEMISLGFIKPNSVKANLYTKFEKSVLSKVDSIIVSSDDLKKFYTEDYSISDSKITVVHDGVNTNLFSPRKKNIELLKELQLPDNSHIIVYLGSVERQQGIFLMLESVAEVIKKRKDVFFLFMGAEVDITLDQCMKKCSELGITEFVKFTGKMQYEKAAEYLSLGDIALSGKLSTTESDGKILTYMAMGLPVICIDTKINRTFLDELGIYVEKNNKIAYANQILELLSDVNRINKLSQLLRQRAEQQFSWEKSAKKINNIYDSLI